MLFENSVHKCVWMLSALRSLWRGRRAKPSSTMLSAIHLVTTLDIVLNHAYRLSSRWSSNWCHLLWEPVKDWSRSDFSITCFAYFQKYLPFYSRPFRSIQLHFLQIFLSLMHTPQVTERIPRPAVDELFLLLFVFIMFVAWQRGLPWKFVSCIV